jgi:hypothetical protein
MVPKCVLKMYSISLRKDMDLPNAAVIYKLAGGTESRLSHQPSSSKLQ